MKKTTTETSTTQSPQTQMTTQTNMTPATATTTTTSKVVLSTHQAKAFVAAALTSEKVFVSYKSEPTPAAEHKDRKLVKTTSGVFLSGINYAELPAIKQAIEKGERGEVQSPNGAEWVVFPLVLRSLKTGKEQVRLTFGDEKPASTFEVDGVRVSKEHFESFLVQSKRSGSRPFSPVFNVSAENILTVVPVL